MMKVLIEFLFLRDVFEVINEELDQEKRHIRKPLQNRLFKDVKCIKGMEYITIRL